MPLLLVPRDKAEQYTVVAGDTLTSIAAAKCPTFDWKVLARYNFGTEVPLEVQRALCETVGVKVADLPKGTDAPKPEDLALAPDADLAPKLRIPKAWTESKLAVEKTHTVKVKPVLPANAVRLTELDKWFIPDIEKCEVKYALSGKGEHASKVQFDIFGSKYCECTKWNKGQGTYADPAALIDVPVYTAHLGAQAAERQSYGLPGDGWKGEVTTRQGLLGRNARSDVKRYVNVAFSPYTAHVRYWKADGDKTAHLVVKGFWPSWEKDAAGTLAKIDASFKVKWEVRHTTKLDRGLLEIHDGAGKLVFQKPLAKAKVGQGVNEFAWDGKYSPGITNSKAGDAAIAEDMPYRVQIEAHTGEDVADALALAARHTEVRLYVHPKTHHRKEEGFDPGLPLVPAKLTDKPGDPNSLKLELAPLYLGTKAPEDKDKLYWLQHGIANAGFPCGPVNGKDSDVLKTALREFQRAVPKHKTGATYERQAVTGATSADTKAAIEHIENGHRRAWFGDPDDPARPDLKHGTEVELDTLAARLTDPAKKMIVWVDWRHAYTLSDTDQSKVTIDNYRGGMQKGDGVVADDETIVCRPWLPLRAQMQLLSREKGLYDEVPLETDKAKLGKMRRAIGPLRTDWAFAEIAKDVDAIATAPHIKQRVRSKRYVDWALDENKKTHAHKSPKRDIDVTNCPKANGGVRPDGASFTDYYKQVFGHEDTTRAEPWPAMPVDTTETIATVVHDHLCADQELVVDAEPADDAGDPLDDKNMGYAGVAFRPSTIGGDGYRVRAQLRFEKVAGKYELPNLEYLERRYIQLPQACSAELRVWRRSSFRGRIGWGPGDNHFDAVRTLYAGGHTHFVHELGASADYTPSQLVNAGNAADWDTYKTLLHGKCHGPYNMVKDDMAFSDAYAFPWYDNDDLGCKFSSDADIPLNEVQEKLVNAYEAGTWGLFQETLLLDLTRRIEGRDGRMRGHIMAPFTSSADVYAQQYKCQGCGKKFWYLHKDGVTDLKAGEACPDCGDSGDGGIQPDGECDGTYSCSHAGCGYSETISDWYPNGGKLTGGDCSNGHVGQVVLDSVAETAASSAPEWIKDNLVTYGIGNPAGTVWVVDGMAGWEWAHEIGHNRHLEHAADAPVDGRIAQRTALHDSENNTLAVLQVGVDPLNSNWDRCCVMSYVDLQDPPNLYEPASDIAYFCGKCLLRLRGWKVEAIAGGPGTAETVP